MAPPLWDSTSSSTRSTRRPGTRRSADGRRARRRSPRSAGGVRWSPSAVADICRTGSARSGGTATRRSTAATSPTSSGTFRTHFRHRGITVRQLVVRHVEPGDAKVVASMIEEIERHYGATVIQPFDERLAQVEAALFGVPPLAYCLLALADGEVAGLATYSFLWPAAGSTHSLFL